MDQTDAWDLSKLGAAIGVYVDRELNKPTVISNSNQYGMTADGQLYTLGQPAGQVVANTSSGKPINSTTLILIAVALYLATRK